MDTAAPTPPVAFNNQGEPRWARGNHVQDANDASARGIIIETNSAGWKEVATTTGAVMLLRSLTHTSLTAEEAARCVRPATQADYMQARIDGIRTDYYRRDFQNRFTSSTRASYEKSRQNVCRLYY